MDELKTLLDCGDFNPHLLLQIYKNKNINIHFNFDIENFKIFIEKYIKKANKFEEKTGIPKKYFSEKINLSLFAERCYIGYAKVKDIFIYFNDDNDAIFVRDKKIISKISEKKENWLIVELDKNFNKTINKDPEIDPTLYLSNNFKIKKVNNFYIRFYLNSLYDIVIKYNNTYFFFFSLDHINEYSFSNHGGGLTEQSLRGLTKQSLPNFINEKDLLKIRRMLKINKIQISNIIKN